MKSSSKNLNEMFSSQLVGRRPAGPFWNMIPHWGHRSFSVCPRFVCVSLCVCGIFCVWKSLKVVTRQKVCLSSISLDQVFLGLLCVREGIARLL
jgi:hypothetical protein